MEQYYRILTTRRLPGTETDAQIVADGRQSNSDASIVVLGKGQVPQSTITYS
jgi:hypothetical protein